MSEQRHEHQQMPRHQQQQQYHRQQQLQQHQHQPQVLRQDGQSYYQQMPQQPYQPDGSSPTHYSQQQHRHYAPPVANTINPGTDSGMSPVISTASAAIASKSNVEINSDIIPESGVPSQRYNSSREAAFSDIFGRSPPRSHSTDSGSGQGHSQRSRPQQQKHQQQVLQPLHRHSSQSQLHKPQAPPFAQSAQPYRSMSPSQQPQNMHSNEGSQYRVSIPINGDGFQGLSTNGDIGSFLSDYSLSANPDASQRRQNQTGAPHLASAEGTTGSRFDPNSALYNPPQRIGGAELENNRKGYGLDSYEGSPQQLNYSVQGDQGSFQQPILSSRAGPQDLPSLNTQLKASNSGARSVSTPVKMVNSGNTSFNYSNGIQDSPNLPYGPVSGSRNQPFPSNIHQPQQQLHHSHSQQKQHQYGYNQQHAQHQQHQLSYQASHSQLHQLNQAGSLAYGGNNKPSTIQEDRSMSMSSSSSAGSSFARPMGTAMTMSGRVIPVKQNDPFGINPGHNQGHTYSQGESQLDNGGNFEYYDNNRVLNKKSLSANALVSSNGNSGLESRSKYSSSATDLKKSSSSASSYQAGISPGSTILTTSRRMPLVYPALLSKVASVFRDRMVLGDKVKNELTYTNAFLGSDAVDLIAYVIKTTDRNLALLLGRSLDAQKLFHDVTYATRLRDSSNEVYRFNEIVMETSQPLGIEAADGSNHTSGELNNGINSTQGTATVAVNGVFTLLTDCYSPTCTRDQLCYSIACPRRLEQQARLNMKLDPGLKRTESRLSIHNEDEKEKKLWIHSVSKEVADSVDDQEKKRQEVICEVIYTERDFVKDLEYLRDFWIKPIRSSNLIPEARRERFIRSVFSFIMDVHTINIKLAESLTKRQQQAPVVQEIGDIFLAYVGRFEPFIRYGANQQFGKYEFEREKSSNPAFTKFVDETERLKESRKLELNGYLTKPTTRLARYPLLLEAVLKHTKDDSPDKVAIPKAIKIIREFLTRVNIETGKAENRFNLMLLSQTLVFRPGEQMDLKLMKKDRQIIFKGFLKKKNGDKDNQGDVQVYLLDNCLLFLKSKIVNKREQLKVYRKPIPLELLIISPNEEGASKGLTKRPSSSFMYSKSVPSKLENAQNKYPLTFQHLGRRGYELTLYGPTFVIRKKWLEQIELQQHVLGEKAEIITQHTLCQRFFDSNNRVNCVIPYDGGRKLLFGTDNGIYLSRIKYEDGVPTTSIPNKIISLPNVTQLDVLHEYSTLLALSDKTLNSWPLEVVEVNDPVSNGKKGKKVMGHINFFKTGLCLGKLLVCTVKSSSMASTVKVLEPTEIYNYRGKKQPTIRKLLQGPNDGGFKVFKEFYIPSETISISFLKSNLCVGCSKGFEVVSLEKLETQSLLDPADTSLDFATRREGLKPLAIYRLNGDFLLNYSDFSFFVNSSGWRTRANWLIQWEGVPQGFALWYPYLMGFEPNFIEIRHIETGEIITVISGDNIRFLHESTREILFVYEDENGFDKIVTLNFWEKSQKKNVLGGAVNGSGASVNSLGTDQTTLVASSSRASMAGSQEQPPAQQAVYRSGPVMID